MAGMEKNHSAMSQTENHKRKHFFLNRAPAWLLLGLALAALFNVGLPIGDLFRLRVTELLSALLVALALWQWAQGRDGSVYGAIPPWFQALVFAYVGWIVFAAWGRGLGTARFEVWGLLVAVAVLPQARTIRPASFVAAVCGLILLESLAAVALAVKGYSALWFHAADRSILPIGFGDTGTVGGGRLQLGGTLGHKSFLAAWLALTLPVALAGRMFQGASPALRWLSSAALAAGACVLILSDSLFGMAAVGTGMSLYGLARFLPHLRRRHPDRIPWGAYCLVTVVVIGVGIAALTATDRIALAIKGGAGGSIQARAYLTGEAFRLIAERPWMGWGREGLLHVVDGGFPHAHNLFLMKWIENGLAGGALFTTLMTILLLTALRRLFAFDGNHNALQLPKALCAGVLAFGMLSLTDYAYNEPSICATAWMALALAVGPAFKID